MRVGLVAPLLILFGSCANAGIILDQQQLLGPGNMAVFSQTDLAQSFQQAHSNVAGAGILLWSAPAETGDITIALYDNLPDEGGALLASGTALGVSAGSWADAFWAPVSVNPNSTYYLVFTSSNQSLGIAGYTGNSYPSGQVYAHPGYEEFPLYDYAFRTYADDAIPEPASFLLLGAGIAGLIALKRLRVN